jgi:hypothetical protein
LALRGIRVQLVSRGFQVLRAKSALQVTLGLRAYQVRPVLLDPLVSRVFLEMLG